MKSKVPPFIQISESEVLEIGKVIFDKDYSSSLLSFIENPSRTLNYWGGEPNILPLGDEGGKRRVYSFFDMIWLLIIQELREFGMEKPALAVLKDQLLTPIDAEELLAEMQKQRKRIEETMLQQYNMDKGQIEEFFNLLIEKQQEIGELQATRLFSHVMFTLGQKTTMRLFINKAGKYFEYVERDMSSLQKIEDNLSELGTTYICLNLTDLVTKLMCLPQIKDTFKKAVLTADEWKLFEFMKKEKPLSIKIVYKGERIELLEIARQKKIKAEARLTEIMLKGAYETIKIKSEKGNVVNCISTEKIKM